MWSGDGSNIPGDGFSSSTTTPSSGTTLNPAQMQWLLSRMTAEERFEVRDKSIACVKEVTLTRGLPICFATGAGLYALKRQGLIKLSPLTNAIIFGMVPLTIIAADAMFIQRHPCSARVRDRIHELYVQHQEEEANPEVRKSLPAGGKRMPGSGMISYAQLREANRSGMALPIGGGSGTTDDGGFGFASSKGTTQKKQKFNAPDKDVESYISGTPLAGILPIPTGSEEEENTMPRTTTRASPSDRREKQSRGDRAGSGGGVNF